MTPPKPIYPTQTTSTRPLKEIKSLGKCDKCGKSKWPKDANILSDRLACFCEESEEKQEDKSSTSKMTVEDQYFADLLDQGGWWGAWPCGFTFQEVLGGR